MLAQTPQDQYIKVGSVKTRYWVLGDKGLIVILLHGGGGFIECWLDNIFALAQYHRVYAFDMVGAGRSDKPDSQNYACDDWVRFLKSFMDVLQIERATLRGI
jgi:4,5:9,10-diseco-3-hydroxy-5,9,17-trioxoandrosta-1(10),2-diene-4-oate hydrolase